jgi:hypothetical protein
MSRRQGRRVRPRRTHDPQNFWSGAMLAIAEIPRGNLAGFKNYLSKTCSRAFSSF